MTNIQLINAISDITKNYIKYHHPSPEQVKSLFTKLLTSAPDTFVKENTQINYVRIVNSNNKELNTSQLLKEYRLKKINKK